MKYAFSNILSLIIKEKEATEISTFTNLFCILTESHTETIQLQSRGNVCCNHP